MQPEQSIPVFGTIASDLQGLPGRIRIARRASDLSQKELGAALGVTDRAVRLWESGTREPRRRTIEQIATATGCDLTWLYTGQAAA